MVNFILVANMKPISLPNYIDLQTVLSQTDLKSHPSQVHGLICGMMCGTHNLSSAWQQLVAGEEAAPAVQEILQALYEGTWRQLKDFLFELQLMLPADEASLQERAEALTLWAQGFLTGLKLAQVPIVDREASDVTEAINDLVEIAKMKYEAVVDTEDDELAYVELVEYVRVAVIYIYQDLQDDVDAFEVGVNAANRFH